MDTSTRDSPPPLSHAFILYAHGARSYSRVSIRTKDKRVSLLVRKSSQSSRTFLEARLDGCQESAIALSLDAAQHVCVKHDSELGNFPRIGTYQATCINYAFLRSLPITLISLSDLTAFSALLTMLLELYQPPPSKLDTYYILSEIA
jgi:hypothetical protein